jgi:hypothetical protein
VKAFQFILAGALAALPAMATPITFTVSDTATGILSDGPFSNALVTFTEVTDTTLIANCPGEPYPCAPAVTTNTVTIAGVGTFTLTGSSYFFDNSINVGGITNEVNEAYLAVENSTPFATYNMTTSVGPVTFSIYSGSAVSSVATSDGSLSISSFGADATFQAVVGTVSSTPEPGSLGLALLGALPLAAVLLRRRFNSPPASPPSR